MRVRFTGTNGRLQKVSFTKLLRYEFDFSLEDAKRRTDALLEGKKFVIEAENRERAEDLIRKARELGATCELVHDQ